MDQPQINIPSVIYWIVGVVVLGNVGTIISFWVMSLRVSWWLAGKMASYEHRLKEAEKDVDAAHEGLRDLRSAIIGGKK